MKRGLVLILLSALSIATLAVSISAQEVNSTPTQSVLIGCIPKHQPFTLSLEDLSSSNGVLKSLTPLSSDARFDYVLLLDVSASVRESAGLELANAAALLHTLVRKDKDRGSLILIDSKLSTFNRFTMDPEEILTTARSAPIGGGTALFDGVKLAVSLLERLPNPAIRVIFVVSDGEDTWSKSLRDDALARVLESGTHVIAVSPNDTNFELRGNRTLKQFTSVSGGRFIMSGYGRSEKDVLKSASRQFAELKYLFDHWYWLEIAPSKPGEKRWERDLKTKAKCELVAPAQVRFDY